MAGIVSARLMKGPRDAMAATDGMVGGGALMADAAGQVTVSPVAGSIASSFVPPAKTCRSGARGVG